MDDRLLQFEWDERKAQINFAKHGVTFEEAALTFFDESFIRTFDATHSEIEARYIGIGEHPASGLLVTCYTERGDNIRIISARKANKRERRDYEAFSQ
jgi:uncharacterized DUF497 family protein